MRRGTGLLAGLRVWAVTVPLRCVSGWPRSIEAQGPLDDRRVLIKKQLMDASTAIVGVMLERREELSALELQPRSPRLATIQAVQVAYANTIMAIDDAVRELKEDIENKKFVCDDGRIVSRSCQTQLVDPTMPR